MARPLSKIHTPEMSFYVGIVWKPNSWNNASAILVNGWGIDMCAPPERYLAPPTTSLAKQRLQGSTPPPPITIITIIITSTTITTTSSTVERSMVGIRSSSMKPLCLGRKRLSWQVYIVLLIATLVLLLLTIIIPSESMIGHLMVCDRWCILLLEWSSYS